MRINEPVRKRHSNITTRELAAKFNVCARTVRNHVAESRKDFEQRAADRRKAVFNMRFHLGMSYDEIAVAMNATKPAVARLFFASKKEHAPNFPTGRRIATLRRPQSRVQ